MGITLGHKYRWHATTNEEVPTTLFASRPPPLSIIASWIKHMTCNDPLRKGGIRMPNTK